MAKNNTIKVNLAFPVEWNGETHESLTFRRLQLQDMVALETAIADGRSESDANASLYASMAGVAREVIDKLDHLEDVPKVAESLVPFFDVGEDKTAYHN